MGVNLKALIGKLNDETRQASGGFGRAVPFSYAL